MTSQQEKTPEISPPPVLGIMEAETRTININPIDVFLVISLFLNLSDNMLYFTRKTVKQRETYLT